MTCGDSQEPRTTPAGQTHMYLWLIQRGCISLPLGASRHLTGMSKMHLSSFNSFFFLFSFPHPSCILPASRQLQKPPSLSSSGQQHHSSSIHPVSSTILYIWAPTAMSKASVLYYHDTPMQQVHPELKKNSPTYSQPWTPDKKVVMLRLRAPLS